MTSTDRRSGALSPAKRALLAQLRGGTGKHEPALSAIPPRPDPRTAPATRSQQSLWFLDQYLGAGANSTYNLWSALRLRGDLDTALLTRCLERVVARHEVLRTTFGCVDGRVEQRIAPPGPLELPVRETTPAEAAEAVGAAAREPFDLVRGPLLRPVLFRMGPGEHVLLLAAHHTVFDGISAQVLLRETSLLYAAGRTGTEAGLPEITTQFGDWAAWTREPGQQAEQGRQLKYWAERLADAPALLELPTDRPRPLVQSFDGAETGITIGRPTTEALRALCKEEGVTLFTALLAAYQVLLARHSGQRDVCVGVPAAGRSHPETQDLIGFFVNTLVVRGQVDASHTTFRTLLREARRATAEAYAHQDVPFDQVVAELCPDRGAAHNPLFQAYLDVTPAGAGAVEFAGFECEDFVLPAGDAKFDLSLGVTEHEDRMEAVFDYRTDLFDAVTAERFAARFAELLSDVVAAPDRRLGDLPPLPADELSRELAAGEGDAVRVDDDSLGAALSAQAARTPDAVAVRYDGAELTYRALESRAAGLARLLIAQGAGPGRTVAVAVPRSLELIVALGAVVRSGAAYLPLDSDHPADRLRFMVEEARPVCVLTTGGLLECLPEGRTQIVLDDPAVIRRLGELPDGPVRDGELPSPRHESDPAYALYTSGSTGRPKGVLVPHRGVLNRLRWMQAEYGLTPADRVLQKTPSSFDVSVWEFFWPLLEGAALVVARPDGHRDPHYLAELVRSEGVTTAHFVPSMLDVFLQEPASARCRSLRRVIASGEALPAPLAGRFHQVLPAAELHNLYGPTEASVDVTHWHCRPGADGTEIPIGRPVWNTAVRLLDDAFQPVPPGSPGELFLSGVQLALGYLHRPGLTAERFVPDPWGPAGSRMYRTGDLGRRRADGALMFLGRTDDQVKIRGLRIELGEIEAVLSGHPDVVRALVTVRTGRPGEQRVTAYVVTGKENKEKEPPKPDELRELAAASLPQYMVPADIVLLDALPTTVNGKVDKGALPVPEPARLPAAAVPETGQEAVLCSIYTELLGLDDVGPLDDFFVLGGDSIGSIQLVGRARRAGLLLTARQIFEHRTPRGLAAVAAPVDDGPGEPAPEDEGTGTLPLTPIMRWWRGRGGPTGGFHQSMLVSTPRGMTGRQLAAVLQALLDRHDMLRAVLARGPEGGELLDVPPPGTTRAEDALTRIDAAGPGRCPGPGGARAGHEAAAAEDLVPEEGRMVRAVWFDAGPEAPGQLLLLVHHLAVDGVSWRILGDDLARAWQDVAASRPPRLDPVPVSFRRWSRLLHESAVDPGREAELAHWSRTFESGGPLLERVGAAKEGRDTVDQALTLSRTLPAGVTGALLGSVPARFRTGPEQVLLTGLALAAAAWTAGSGPESRGALAVSLEGHGREESVAEVDLSRTVGWFTSLYPVLLDVTGIDADEALAGGEAAGTALKRVKEQLAGVPGRGIGHGLLRWLNPVASQTLSALPEPLIGFNYLGRFGATGAEEAVRDWQAVPGEPLMGGGVPAGTPVPSPLDIVALTEDGPDGPRLTASFTWPGGLLPEHEVHELADLWTRMLEGLARHTADPAAGGVTPSDLTLAGLAQDEIDDLQAELALDWEAEL
ncbi:non-ribosomal peptide synthetase [Streptomyces winkii]|uniref:non-ribosomal peptide synthetase n=1 Tax=Streptomyces winkii TaxID=3051178 RepID=UPI0028D88454|nr:non-ribosomal peptide synthetase [Streptomyces sp. DSM 40971]